MKNFNNRIGYRNNNNNNAISDAREVLSAKRNSSNGNNNVKSGKYVDARMMMSNRVPNRSESRPQINFTIPKKTVQNELYIREKPQMPYLPFNQPIRSNSKISLSTNKFSGKNYCDPNASQGIFSNNLQDTVISKPSFPSKNHSDQNNSLKRPNFKPANVTIEASPKRKRESSVDNMKFTVVNVKPVVENKKPALSTAKFAQKTVAPVANISSLVSPIQGYRIEVKNLHPQVNVDDVDELFKSLGGELRSCNLVRPGYAEVVFRKLVDAEKSIEEFHGRELDGKPMNLKLVTPALESISNDSSNNDIKVKIGRIQANRKPVHNMQINKDAVFRSMYAKSADTSKLNKKPFKFSVTL